MPWAPDGLVRTDTDGHSWTEQTRPRPCRPPLPRRDSHSVLSITSNRRGGGDYGRRRAPQHCSRVGRQALWSRPVHPQNGPRATITGTQALKSGAIEQTLPDAAWRSSKYMTEEAADDLRHWLGDPEFDREQRRPATANGSTARDRRKYSGNGSAASEGLSRFGQDTCPRRTRGAPRRWRYHRPAREEHPGRLLQHHARQLLCGTSRVCLCASSYSDPNKVTFLHWHGWARRVMHQLDLADEWARAFTACQSDRSAALGELVRRQSGTRARTHRSISTTRYSSTRVRIWILPGGTRSG